MARIHKECFECEGKSIRLESIDKQKQESQETLNVNENAIEMIERGRKRCNVIMNGLESFEEENWLEEENIRGWLKKKDRCQNKYMKNVENKR